MNCYAQKSPEMRYAYRRRVLTAARRARVRRAQVK